MQATCEGVWRIPGGQHANVLSSREELLRQRLDVPVHAPLEGPGIGGNQRDAHRVRVAVRVSGLRVCGHPCSRWLQAKATHAISPSVPTVKKVAAESLATTPSAQAAAAPAKPARARGAAASQATIRRPVDHRHDHGQHAEPEQGRLHPAAEAARRQPQAPLDHVRRARRHRPRRSPSGSGARRRRARGRSRTAPPGRAPARPPPAQGPTSARARGRRRAPSSAATAAPAGNTIAAPTSAPKRPAANTTAVTAARRRGRRPRRPARRADVRGRPGAVSAAPTPTGITHRQRGLELVADAEEAHPQPRIGAQQRLRGQRRAGDDVDRVGAERDRAGDRKRLPAAAQIERQRGQRRRPQADDQALHQQLIGPHARPRPATAAGR